MEIREIESKVAAGAPGCVRELREGPGDPSLIADAAKIVSLARFLKEDGDLRFDYLTNLSGLDETENLTVVYHLRSTVLGHGVEIRASVPRETPEIDSVTSVWGGANWFEREAFDLFGIVFRGHPDLRRIMLPDDWEGHPLRKDYEDPKRYRDIDNTRDYGI